MCKAFWAHAEFLDANDLACWNLAHLERVRLMAGGWSAERLGAPLGQSMELQCVTVSAHSPPAASNCAQAPVPGF